MGQDRANLFGTKKRKLLSRERHFHNAGMKAPEGSRLPKEIFDKSGHFWGSCEKKK